MILINDLSLIELGKRPRLIDLGNRPVFINGFVFYNNTGCLLIRLIDLGKRPRLIATCTNFVKH